jgi:hypothetical protein
MNQIFSKNRELLAPRYPPLFYIGQLPGQKDGWYIFWGKYYWNKFIESKLAAMVEADRLNQALILGRIREIKLPPPNFRRTKI